jgi:hypothetical protein
MISFVKPEQIKIAAEICQSFCMDNGAYLVWRLGAKFETDRYYSWIGRWIRHPGFDFAVVPDRLDGTEDENDKLLEQWPFERWQGWAV